MGQMHADRMKSRVCCGENFYSAALSKRVEKLAWPQIIKKHQNDLKCVVLKRVDVKQSEWNG